MKVEIESGKFKKSIRIPMALMDLFLKKYMAELSITKKQRKLLKKYLKQAKKEMKGFPLVEIESSDGDRVNVIL